MTSASDEKCHLSIGFSGQRSGGSPTGPDPKNRVGDQDFGRQVRPVSYALYVPSDPGSCRARTRQTS